MKAKWTMQSAIENLDLALKSLKPFDLEALDDKTAFALGHIHGAAITVVKQWRKKHGPGTGKVRRARETAAQIERDAAGEPGESVNVVHLLRGGYAACFFSQEVPGDWPEGHKWALAIDREHVTCPECKRAYAESPPWPTGKPPEEIDMEGMLIPWVGDQPELLRMPGSPSFYLPCFADERALRVFMTKVSMRKPDGKLDARPLSIKKIDDAIEVLLSLPDDVKLIANPHLLPNGHIRFTEVQRPQKGK